MDISFDEIRQKEVINISTGKKLGHVIDIVFDLKLGLVRGVVLPGERKLFKKSDDIFVSLSKIKTIGDDVVLVAPKSWRESGALQDRRAEKTIEVYQTGETSTNQRQKYRRNGSFVRFRRINNNKY